MRLSPNSHMESPCHSNILNFVAIKIFRATRSNFEREFLYEFFELESEYSINFLVLANFFQWIDCCIATSSSSGCVNYGQFQTAKNVHCQPLDSTSDFSAIFSENCVRCTPIFSSSQALSARLLSTSLSVAVIEIWLVNFCEKCRWHRDFPPLNRQLQQAISLWFFEITWRKFRPVYVFASSFRSYDTLKVWPMNYMTFHKCGHFSPRDSDFARIYTSRNTWDLRCFSTDFARNRLKRIVFSYCVQKSWNGSAI